MSSKEKSDEAYQTFDKEIFSHKDENNFKLHLHRSDLFKHCPVTSIKYVSLSFYAKMYYFQHFVIYIYYLLCTVTHTQLLEDFIYPCRI